MVPARLSDREVAEAAARAAGAVVREAFGRPVAVESKTSPTDPVTAVDRAAEAAATAVLERERPDDARLGEETGDAAGTSGRRWTIDALDGTLNFVSGVPLFCCAVGLEDGAGGVASAVLDPSRDELFSGARGEGAWLDGTPLQLGEGRSLREVVVCTYVQPERPALLDGVRAIAAAGAQVRSFGTGSLELAWVAAGRLGAWVQVRPARWDWLPGSVLVEQAGGTAAALEGDPGWHIAAAGELHAELVRLVAAERHRDQAG
jgi:fructose-1,6-bisphosphatase/inositol monophosphatase family enzyme